MRQREEDFRISEWEFRTRTTSLLRAGRAHQDSLTMGRRRSSSLASGHPLQTIHGDPDEGPRWSHQTRKVIKLLEEQFSKPA